VHAPALLAFGQRHGRRHFGVKYLQFVIWRHDQHA
jgi:hypothetical protein